MNLTLSVSDNYYMTMSQDAKAQDGEDITVIFDIPQTLGYRVRFDYRNGVYVERQYITNQTEYTIKAPANRAGFLQMQIVFDTDTMGKRKTNVIWLHVARSIGKEYPDNVLLQELERLAFVEVQTDADTEEAVFYSLSGDEVGRIQLGGGAVIGDLTQRVVALEETASQQGTEITSLQEALATMQTDIDNIPANYYNKTEVDNLIDDLATTEDIQTAIDNIPVADLDNNGLMTSGYVQAMQNNADNIQRIMSDYITSTNLNNALADYSTTEQMETAIDTAVTGLTTETYVDEQIANRYTSRIALLMDDTDAIAPVYFGTNGANTEVHIRPGTYQMAIGTREVTDITMPDETFTFDVGKVICLHDLGNMESFDYVLADDLQTALTDDTYYPIARMNYVNGIPNLYIYGFGNYTNTPATVGSTNANVLAVPSTFTATWTSATQFVMSAGTYYFKESSTGLVTNMTLPETTLVFSFASVICYRKGTAELFIASPLALPTDAVIIGNMNNINGQAVIYLNGLQSFPYEAPEGGE